jgi:hypothetical protein
MPYLLGYFYGRKNALSKKKSTDTENLILDTVTGADLAYGLRRLTNNYTGNCIKVRRSSDNEELDVGFTGNNLNTATLLSFVGTYSAYVTTWYDQAGGNNNAVQATTDNQPKLVNAGTLLDGVSFVDANTILNAGKVFNNEAETSTFAKVKISTFSTNRIFDKSEKIAFVDSAGRLTFGQDYSSGDGLWRTNSSISTDTMYKLLFTYTGVTAETPKFYVDGSEYTEKTTTSAASGTLVDDSGADFIIGNRAALDRRIQGFINELILFDKVLSETERTNINTL